MTSETGECAVGNRRAHKHRGTRDERTYLPFPRASGPGSDSRDRATRSDRNKRADRRRISGGIGLVKSQNSALHSSPRLPKRRPGTRHRGRPLQDRVRSDTCFRRGRQVSRDRCSEASARWTTSRTSSRRPSLAGGH